jgi:hypothetical protein
MHPPSTCPDSVMLTPCPRCLLCTHVPPRAPYTAMVSSNLELHRYGTGRKTRVATAMTLLKSHLFR